MKIFEIYRPHHKILLVGALPPPLGGVSVHIDRLFKALQKDKQVRVFNTSKKHFGSLGRYLKLISLMLIFRPDIVHVHTTERRILQLVQSLRSILKFSLFFTDHNSRLFDSLDERSAKFYHDFVANLDLLIVVGQAVLDKYHQHNVVTPENVEKISAYIPPPLAEKEVILNTYPGSLRQFLQRHNPVICANAFQVVFLEDEDLYGLDLTVELCGLLVKKYPQFGLIFCLANGELEKEYVRKQTERLRKYGVGDNFFLLTGQREMWPLLTESDLLIRPTLTDGHSISIDEALDLGCPVVASDAVEREQDVVLFRNRDVHDLHDKVLSVLDKSKKLSTD